VLKVDREVERAIQAHEETVASKYDPRQGFSIGPRRRSRADRGFAETESGIQSELRSIGARTWLTESGRTPPRNVAPVVFGTPRGAYCLGDCQAAVARIERPMLSVKAD
jgi:hypothetical protein